jgi:calcineurin-like phosphoesterase family protein
MSRIFLTSDLHFAHDQPFLWGSRGFNSIWEHDEAVIANWNSVVNCDDVVYVLGDAMLGDNTYGRKCISRLKGNIYLVRGNHDTDARWNEVYPTIHNVTQLGFAEMLKYRKWNFYLSHFPTETTNYDDDKKFWQRIINLCGHTHSKEKFHKGNIFQYNVALDAHNNTPVLLDDIIQDIKDNYPM